MCGRSFASKLGLSVVVVFIPLFVHAYSTDTHYKLTENAAREYDRLGGTLHFTTNDMVTIASGAVEEDEM